MSCKRGASIKSTSRSVRDLVCPLAASMCTVSSTFPNPLRFTTLSYCVHCQVTNALGELPLYDWIWAVQTVRPKPSCTLTVNSSCGLMETVALPELTPPTAQ